MCYDYIRILNGQQFQRLKSQPLSFWISEFAQVDQRRGYTKNKSKQRLKLKDQLKHVSKPACKFL